MRKINEQQWSTSERDTSINEENDGQEERSKLLGGRLRANLPLPLRALIVELWTEGHRPGEIQRRCELAHPDAAPTSLRAYQGYAKQLAQLAGELDEQPWLFRTASPDAVKTILHVVFAVAEQTHGRIVRCTQHQADLFVRVHLAAPRLSGLDVWRIAEEMRWRERFDVDVDDVLAMLGCVGRANPRDADVFNERSIAYGRLHRERWPARPNPLGLIDRPRAMRSGKQQGAEEHGEIEADGV